MKKKILCVALALMLLMPCVTLAEDAFVFGQAKICFDGAPYCNYADDHLIINVQRVEENNIVYFVCDVQVKSFDVLSSAFVSDKNMASTDLMENIAQKNGAVLAINADFCGDHTSGVIIRNGNLYRSAKTNKLDMLIVDRNGDFTLHYDRSQDDAKAFAQELMDQNVWQTFEFGPALVENGQALPLDNKTHVISTRSTQLEPRTGIGQLGKLHYIVIVVEGRREGYSDGVSLQGFQQLFLKYGAQTAINLDGGGSAKLYFYNQVINRPSSPSRQVSDALIFK